MCSLFEKLLGISHKVESAQPLNLFKWSMHSPGRSKLLSCPHPPLGLLALSQGTQTRCSELEVSKEWDAVPRRLEPDFRLSHSTVCPNQELNMGVSAAGQRGSFQSL